MAILLERTREDSQIGFSYLLLICATRAEEIDDGMQKGFSENGNHT